MTAAGRQRTSTPVLALLGLIAVIAIFLRTWGLEYATVHPDDPKQIFAATKYVEGNYAYSLDEPDRYVRGYPFFAMHLVEWSYRAYEGVLRHVAPGRGLPWQSLPPDDYKMLLRRIGLTLNCLYELAALGLVFLIGRRLFDPWAGLATAAIFALSSLRIQVSHMIGADLPEGLFVIGVFFFATRLRERDRLRDWLGAGVCAGLAAAAKYHGLFSLLAPALVFLELRWRAGWRGALAPRRLAAPLLVAIGFVAAFALATPALLIDPGGAVAAIRTALGATVNFGVPDEYVDRRLAFVVKLLPNHANNFLRFFEPLPGWLMLASIGFFAVKRRLRESFLWVYPLALFPVGVYGFPVAAPYHYLGVLTPLLWVIGFAVASALRALRGFWLRVPAALLFGGWMLAAAASDASVFSLPAASELAERWFADCATPGRFEIMSTKSARKQVYPRLFGIDFENFSTAALAEREREAAVTTPVVARFELEKRTPTLNHMRNRPHRIRWSDGRSRDVELFPPPRRIAGGWEEPLFPDNLTLSRSPALLVVTPRQAVVRRVRRGPDAASWLLYAHYPARAGGRDRARLRVATPDGRRDLLIASGDDLLADLDLSRTDLLYNGLFSSVWLEADEPLFIYLVSPAERGWFLLTTGRWRELEAWERDRHGWKSAARRSVARRHLGENVSPEDAAACETALPGFRTGDPAERYRAWTAGIDLDLYEEPRPAYPMERFIVRAFDEELLPTPDLPPDSRLIGPYEQLLPGFYRVTWEVSGAGGSGNLEYRITGDSGLREIAARTSALPEGRQLISLPLRVTSASPGWDLEFLVVNRGSRTVRVEGVRLENDPEPQLKWWLGELTRALPGPAR